ncbi:hypothetical protein BK120_08805 [Paenibacillus sp. FSL A5-0031]|uniref:hypothetical protein n=1 Tax=Paenibacillus sp. FSL A5-0031 TaxID=1920420 RepID=UPI00096D0919|nr:hypothetical protein [Paenibacillus sp. FSL A5-0031]OME86080.1 hypothetical protein BK120_08805 [Paenibacillus sp. FSL A5-0031]
MQFLQMFTEYPIAVLLLAFISSVPIIKPYFNAISRTGFDELHQTKEHNMWQKFIKQIINVFVLNFVLMFISILLYISNDSTDTTSESSPVGNVVATVLFVIFLCWGLVAIFLIILILIFTIQKKTSIKDLTRKFFMVIVPVHGITTFYIYLLFVVFYFSQYFSFKSVGYMEGIVLIVVLMMAPLLLYYLYFEVLPKDLLISNKVKTYYQLKIPSESEQRLLDNKGLIILYSLDSRNIILCEEEYLHTKDELYRYDKEQGKYYYYIKKKISE